LSNRLFRWNNSLDYLERSGLYPCGEGAGYAGGIVSAAIDGMRVADAACGSTQQKTGTPRTVCRFEKASC